MMLPGPGRNAPGPECILEHIMDKANAMALLEWAHGKNPGPWREHSLGVARAAEYIARECGDIDPERAWVMGALHDIGRYEGFTYMRHIVTGYELMLQRGEPETARICITHSFPYPDIGTFIGKQDVDADDVALIKTVIAGHMDDYDRLIQLCDALTWGEGVCLMEKRMIDVIRRYGCTPMTQKKISATMEIFEDFQRRIGKSIYSLFPEAAENTFGI